MQRDTQRNHILAYVHTQHSTHALYCTFRPTSKPAGDQDTSPQISLPCPQTKLLFLSSSSLSSPCSKPLLCSPLLFSQPGPASLLLSLGSLSPQLFLNPTSSPLPVSMLPPSSSQASSIPFLSFCSRGNMTSRASESQTYTKSYLQASEGCVHSEVQAPPP